MSETSMRGCDAIAAPLADCYITVDGKRYHFMQMIDFEARMVKRRFEVPVLGHHAVGNKSAGWQGVFSGRAHYNERVLRNMLYEFKRTGKEIYFEIQVSNEDPASGAGKQTVVLMDCTLDGGVLTKFDADGTYLSETVQGTFEDFHIPHAFSDPNGTVL